MKREGRAFFFLMISYLANNHYFNKYIISIHVHESDPRKNCEQGEVFVKFCRVKKVCVGDGGELELALNDMFGIWVTVRSCCEKRIETKLCKSRRNSPAISKVFENKFGQVVEKPSDLILCLLVS